MRLPSPTAAEVGVAAALSSQVVVYLIIESTCVTSRRAFIWTESRSEEHTSELQSQSNLVCRLLLEKKKKKVRPGIWRFWRREHSELLPRAAWGIPRDRGSSPTFRLGRFISNLPLAYCSDLCHRTD